MLQLSNNGGPVASSYLVMYSSIQIVGNMQFTMEEQSQQML